MSDLILWLNFFIINLFNLTLEFSSLALTFQLVRMAKTYNLEYIAPYDAIAIYVFQPRWQRDDLKDFEFLFFFTLSALITWVAVLLIYKKESKMDQAFDIVPKG